MRPGDLLADPPDVSVLRGWLYACVCHVRIAGRSVVVLNLNDEQISANEEETGTSAVGKGHPCEIYTLRAARQIRVKAGGHSRQPGQRDPAGEGRGGVSDGKTPRLSVFSFLKNLQNSPDKE